MKKDTSESHVRIRHNRTFAACLFQLIDRCRHISTADQVKPFLNVVFKYELGVFLLAGLAFGREEKVQIELIELRVHGNLPDRIRKFICHEYHLRQCCIRIFGRLFPVSLCLLLITIGPVVYLIFDKLTCIQTPERSSGQVEVIARGYRKERLVVSIVCFFGLIFLYVKSIVGVVIFLFKELLCVLSPCAEMIFVKYNKVPVCSMHPLILGFDSARLRIYTEEVLKRTEANDRLALIELIRSDTITKSDLP